MKQITLCTFFLLCLGSMPLWAPHGEEGQTQENTKFVAAAANSSALQTKTPAVAKAAPRKVLMSRPEPLMLDLQALRTLQSTKPEDAEAKEKLLKHAARTVNLFIEGNTQCPLVLPDNTTMLMKPFVNVRSLTMTSVYSVELPLLPCPQKLESLMTYRVTLMSTRNIQRHSCLRELALDHMSFDTTGQHPNQTDRLAVLAKLNNLRELHVDLHDGTPIEEKLFERIVQNNPQITDFNYRGVVTKGFVRSLGTLPLVTLQLRDSQIDDVKFALLPFGTLQTFRLEGEHNLKDLTPLQGAPLCVLALACYTHVDEAFFQAILSMQTLEKFYLSSGSLTDEQGELFLRWAQELSSLHLTCSRGFSEEMCEKLRKAFGKRARV
ncbi:MAG: hypothetical protein ACPGUZ_02055 [Holosporaceae bacterium]